MFCTIYTGEDAPNQRQPVPRLVSHWRVRFYWSWLTAFCCYLSLYAFNKLSSHVFNKHCHYSGTAWLNQMTENIVKEAMRRRVWLYSTISMETVCIFNICICIFIYSVYIRQSDLWRRRVQLHTIERWKTIAKKIYVLSKNKKKIILPSRNQMAWRGMPPRKANHLWGWARTLEVMLSKISFSDGNRNKFYSGLFWVANKGKAPLILPLSLEALLA